MNDLSRLRTEYADRKRRFAHDDRYSPSNAAFRFLKAQVNENAGILLRRHGRRNLANCRILEVGCGNGSILMDFYHLGAEEHNLYGVDLLPDRLAQAHVDHPTLALVCADGQHLPYGSASFDLALQYTALSSILDPAIKSNLAHEMLRVLNQDGLIFSYDFWLNPTNRQTRGIRPAEIKRLFPDCQYEFRRITLAPPIARRLATVSWSLCLFLESLKIFNTHYLVAITRGAHGRSDGILPSRSLSRAP
jgi:ubiquinone/menaquinone biosynthesis C-methylase UbiE